MRRRLPRSSASVVLLAAALASPLALSPPASAQPAADGAAAQALYDAAGELMDQKRWDDACPKLEEAVRIAPAAVGAKLRLAQCFEGQSRLASAWSMFLAAESAATAAGQGERAQKAHDGARALSARLSRLTVTVPASLRALPGLAVERDGAPVGAGQWSVAIPLDGGRHQLVATAAGKARWQRDVELAAEGGAATVEIGPLLDLPAAMPSPSSSAAASASPPPSSSSEPRPPGGPPLWSWIAGAGGLALGAAGAGFAIDLKLLADKQVELCGPAIDHCESASPPYDPSGDNQRKSRDYSLGLVFGGAGIALLAAGAIGFALAPPRTTSPPPIAPRARLAPSLWASPSGAGVTLAGTF